MRILISGICGFVGSTVARELLAAGHHVTGFDNYIRPDPFTMYKVFRRECLRGLTLESNRFDFDWELLIKLVRKGYRPLEIPIRYKSRSFKEGKKVSMFRDPPNWIIAWAKYRFQRL